MFSRFFLFFCTVCLLFTCQDTKKSVQTDLPISIIPQVKDLQKSTGFFQLDKATKIVLPNQKEDWQWVAAYFNNEINPALGTDLEMETSDSENRISFEQVGAMEGAEAYELQVDPYEIIIRSKNANGAFYAVQTLLQLLPPKVLEKKPLPLESLRIPALKIIDAPRFSYRGMHLDVARHFFSVTKVKKYIDLLAFHKMNHFHWHLTEDQGWRIEIKKYPKLSEISAFRDGTLIGHYNDQPQQFDGKRYGGFYTQEEIKEVVQYAKERFITIVPEIELPGHSQAALAAYPELACERGPYEVWQKWGISDNIYCPTETTFTFLENVLTEVINLFPGPYIHIGGDECPKRAWKESQFCQDLIKRENLKDEAGLQSYFIRRIEKFVNSKGRQIIGWDEILEGGLAPNATVMSWRGMEGGIEAARSGHQVIMTPTSHCYFDYYQSDHTEEPLAIGGFLPLQKVYEYEPIPEELSEEEAKYILGAQGNIWTEYMPNFSKVEYMAFPRVCALSEVNWSAKSRRAFPDFVDRLLHHYQRLEAKEVKAANHLYELKSQIAAKNQQIALDWSTLAGDAMVHYTTDGTDPSAESRVYQKTLTIGADQTVKAQAFRGKQKLGRLWSQSFDLHLATGAKIELSHLPHAKYSAGGVGALINGVQGSNERYGDTEWLGFDGTDLIAQIDLGSTQSLERLKLRCFNGEGQWIYLPKKVEVFLSQDGKQFEKVASTKEIKGSQKAVDINLSWKQTTGQYLKIVVTNHGTIASGKQGAGHNAWLFVDELVLNGR